MSRKKNLHWTTFELNSSLFTKPEQSETHQIAEQTVHRPRPTHHMMECVQSGNFPTHSQMLKTQNCKNTSKHFVCLDCKNCNFWAHFFHTNVYTRLTNLLFEGIQKEKDSQTYLKIHWNGRSRPLFLVWCWKQFDLGANLRFLHSSHSFHPDFIKTKFQLFNALS